MAKEKIKVVKDITDSKNLETNVIGVVETNKNKGSFSLILLFVILIAFAFGLPYVQEYLEKREGDKPVVVPPKKDDNEKDKTPTPEVKVEYYEIKPSTSFVRDGMTFQNFALKDLTLQFQIANDSSSDVALAKNNYYFEFFSKENTMLERVKLATNETLTSKKMIDVTLDVQQATVENATKFTLTAKSDTDMPQVTLNNNEQGIPVLVCQKENRTITYQFDGDKLSKILDSYALENTAENYDEQLTSYRTMTTTYNNLDGVASSIAETSSGFTMTTTIDLAKANIRDIPSSYYFERDTIAKKVNFQMEAMTYTCN